MAKKKYSAKEAAAINKLGGKYKVENGVLKVKVKLSARDKAEGLSPWATSFGKEPAAITNALKKMGITITSSRNRTPDRNDKAKNPIYTRSETGRKIPKLGPGMKMFQGELIPIKEYNIIMDTRKALDLYKGGMTKKGYRGGGMATCGASNPPSKKR